MSWFNSLLFPLAAAARLAGRLTGKEDSDDKLPPRPVNWLFEMIFGLERYALGPLALPARRFAWSRSSRLPERHGRAAGSGPQRPAMSETM